ncbi:hypothetical protein MW887_009919 [Aspergillus wentii]|nr:hypothetical protein MW887_009919 [Aspergillus wentii]
MERQNSTASTNNHSGPSGEFSAEYNGFKDKSISFSNENKALRIPSPCEHDRDDDRRSEEFRRRWRDIASNTTGIPLERVASSMFVIGRRPSEQGQRIQRAVSLSKDSNLPGLSSQASVGRNSQFYNLTARDRETLGGIEYRALRVLLRIGISLGFTYLVQFACNPTWILFGIILLLNAVDVLLIVVLDLNNPAVNNLPGGPRVLAAIFQAASSRHTGTSTFNLADVNPAVQFSLLVMMYVAIFPIAISIRASNTYEERTLGVFSKDSDPDEKNGSKYVISHVRNQLSFDLWIMHDTVRPFSTLHP